MHFFLALIFGILSASFALLLEVVTLNLENLTTYQVSAFDFSSFLTLFFVAIIEEGSKFLFLRQYIRRYLSTSLSNMSRALSLGLIFGLGFVSLEVLLIVGSQPAFLPFWHLLGIAALHIVTSILFTLYLLRFSQNHPRWAPVVLGTLTLLHLLYNYIISWHS